MFSFYLREWIDIFRRRRRSPFGSSPRFIGIGIVNVIGSL